MIPRAVLAGVAGAALLLAPAPQALAQTPAQTATGPPGDTLVLTL